MTTDTNPLGLNTLDTTAAFIDGPNLYASFKSIEPEGQIDFSKLRRMIDDNSRMNGISYYTSLRPQPRDPQQDDYDPVVRLVDFLGHNGYRVYTKVARFYTNDLGQQRMKASVNTEIVIDAYRAAETGINHVVLFASDGDLHALIPALHQKGCKVTLVSTRKDHIVSEDLRWEADTFIDLETIKPHIMRSRNDNEGLRSILGRGFND